MDGREAASPPPPSAVPLPRVQVHAGEDHCLTRGGALRVDVQGVERLAGGHEEPVPLGPAEADIGASFGEPNPSEQLAVGIPHGDAAIADIVACVAAAPEISVYVHANAI